MVCNISDPWLGSYRSVCHDRGFHLYRPSPRPSQTIQRRRLLHDARRHLWLLFHSSLGVLLLHFHQRPHVHDPEEAQIGFRSPATLPTVWHTHSRNHFVYNHFFCGFSSKPIVSFKIFYKKRRKEREEFLRSCDQRLHHKGWHSECKPTESLCKGQQDPAMWKSAGNLSPKDLGWGVAKGGKSLSSGTSSL